MTTDRAQKYVRASRGGAPRGLSRKRVARAQITLARALSKFGIASRSEAGGIIRDGRVAVNGRVVRRPDGWVDPIVDRIELDRKPLRRRPLVYLMMNKPRGIVTTRSDERGRKTVYDLLPEGKEWLFPVGRLDKDSSGLLLLTNDSQFGERLTSPARKMPKIYEVTIDRPLDEGARRQMESGLMLPDGKRCLPVRIVCDRSDPRRWTISMTEGKNRQIRRMCEAFGYTVTALIRISIGGVSLGSLSEGSIRPLTAAELSSLRRAKEE